MRSWTTRNEMQSHIVAHQSQLDSRMSSPNEDVESLLKFVNRTPVVGQFKIFLSSLFNVGSLPEELPIVAYLDGEGVIEWHSKEVYCTITDGDNTIFIVDYKKGLDIQEFNLTSQEQLADAIKFVQQALK